MLINGGGDQPNGEEPHPSHLWVGTLQSILIRARPMKVVAFYAL